MVDDGSIVVAETSDATIVAGDNIFDVTEESILFDNKDTFSGLLHTDDWWDNQALTPRNDELERCTVGLLPSMEIFPSISVDDTLTSLDTYVSISPIQSKNTEIIQLSIGGESHSMNVLGSTRNAGTHLTAAPIQTKKNATEKPLSLSQKNKNPFMPPSSSSSSSVTSVEWGDTLGDHVDIKFSEGIFDSNRFSRIGVNNGNGEVSKDACYEGVPSLISVPSDMVAGPSAGNQIKWTPIGEKFGVSQVPSAPKKLSATKQKTTGTSKSKNPKMMKYVDTPTEMDVLNGGGVSYPGNKRFMEEITKWQPSYLGTEDKAERGRIIENVIHYVHRTQKGRFLEKNAKTGRWHVATPSRIRHKISRTLRESNGHRRRARAAKKAKTTTEKETAATALGATRAATSATAAAEPTEGI